VGLECGGALELIAGSTLTWPLDAVQLDAQRANPGVAPFTAVSDDGVPVGHADLTTVAPGHLRAGRVIVDPPAAATVSAGHCWRR
jgi:hypothetical protein